MVDKFSPLPLYSQVERYLLDCIEQNNLHPGDIVPSENEISAELSISRMTIRQAVNNLVLKGILTRQRGKGTFVNDRNPVRIEIPLDQLRGISQRLSSVKGTPCNKIVRFETCKADSEIARLLKLSEDDDLYYMERLRCIDDDPVVFEATYMPCSLLPEIDESILQDSKYQCLISLGLTPFAADREYLAEIPSEYVASLLKLQRNEPVLKAKSVAYLESHQPFEYSEISYNQKRYRFTVTAEY